MKIRKIKMRIPEGAYQKLRHHGGGAHSTPKGDKGYRRADNKRALRESKPAYAESYGEVKPAYSANWRIRRSEEGG